MVEFRNSMLAFMNKFKSFKYDFKSRMPEKLKQTVPEELSEGMSGELKRDDIEKTLNTVSVKVIKCN